jgi:hypothetical protein
MRRLPDNILQQMLAAAEGAAKGRWDRLSADVTAFAENLLQDKRTTVDDLASGAITELAAEVQFDGIRDQAAMLGNYMDEELKLAAQDAINAAVDVLWDAIKVAAK